MQRASDPYGSKAHTMLHKVVRTVRLSRREHTKAHQSTSDIYYTNNHNVFHVTPCQGHTECRKVWSEVGRPHGQTSSRAKLAPYSRRLSVRP